MTPAKFGASATDPWQAKNSQIFKGPWTGILNYISNIKERARCKIANGPLQASGTGGLYRGKGVR